MLFSIIKSKTLPGSCSVISDHFLVINMGNLLEKTDSNYLLRDILPPLDQLCNCNFYTGSKSYIIKVQKKIAKSAMKGFFIPLIETPSLFRDTPLEDRQAILESHFSYSNK